ncbi:response regulator [Thalassotalea psychrophila]|uniref:histidine kinase n=1 Tax=Thalassotalea psychrophila TaxID=3065647 RepID=A0ABY9TU33_9GAMM|nr:response regulator [Colwelliaceae bacterium SQ149]
MSSSNSITQPSIKVFQAVLDALPFCVFWKDRNSVALGCNQALADVAGLKSPKDYIGKTDYELPWTTEEADFFRECDRRVIESGKAELNIIESQRQANGKIAWLETSKIPLTDTNGEIIGILGAFHDITERKRLEDENIANQKLESLGTLAAGLAHDFNNILMMILGSSQLAKLKMANGADNADIDELLSNIENATSQASVLTEKFMNYSEHGAVTKTVCNLSEMLEEITSFIQSSVNSKIKYEIHDNKGDLYADVNQIHQVLNNLLINAAQASKNNEDITVAIKNCEVNGEDLPDLRSGNYFAISIKDNGIGIPNEHKEDIFKPYFTTKEYGHGLGLSSCLTIVKNHNGTITVESEIDLGSTFTVYLPIRGQNQHIEPMHQPFSNNIMPGSGRILYVEDDANTQEATFEMLKELGYQIQCFSCVQPAVDFIQQHSDDFDLVITDFIIGNDLQGGIEILDSVRQIRADCPVVLITGYFQSLEERAESKPQFSFIAQKPVGIAKISQIVNRFILSTNNANSTKKNPIATNVKTILIVDDEPLIVQFLATYLNYHDYEVITAKSGEIALNKLNEQTVDLIITDQNMPYMTGIELSQEVKQLFPNIPIIISSGYNKEIGDHNIEEFGVSYFHKKGSNNEELLNSIIKLLP